VIQDSAISTVPNSIPMAFEGAMILKGFGSKIAIGSLVAKKPEPSAAQGLRDSKYRRLGLLDCYASRLLAS